MTDRPVIFSAAMVVALLDGRKRMTRRLASSPLAKAKPGDRLWVRERCIRQFNMAHEIKQWGYHVDNRSARDRHGDPIIWNHGERDYCPSIHMPRFISRLTLVVTEIRFERLQDISAADVEAEGLSRVSKDYGRVWKYGIPDNDGMPGTDDHGWSWHEWCADASNAFHHLWEGLHGAGSWEENPELAVISFETHRVNIDRMEIVP